jgi:hypothetical protein
MFFLQIEQWNKQHYPSFNVMPKNSPGSGPGRPMLDPSDVHGCTVQLGDVVSKNGRGGILGIVGNAAGGVETVGDTVRGASLDKLHNQ